MNSEVVHPLDGADEEKCYDIMMAERTALHTAKRASEDELIRTIVKLSSASLLLIPGLVLTRGSEPIKQVSVLLELGALSFALALVAAMGEQYVSSLAYERQIKISQSFYQRESLKREDVKINRCIRAFQATAFVLFIIGVLVSAVGVFQLGNKVAMAQKPTSPTPPARPPSQPSYPGQKNDGGRSVPPPAPPPPSPKR